MSTRNTVTRCWFWHPPCQVAWQHRLNNNVYLQMRNGVQVTRLPKNDLAEVEADAAFARGLLDELDAIAASELSEEDFRTLGFLRFDLGNVADGVELWWTTFPVTPYQTFWIGLYLQQLFAPFRFDGAEDVDRYLGLMRDYAALLRSMLDKLKAQDGRGWLIPQPALPGVRATLAGLKSTSSAVLRSDNGRAVLFKATRSAL